MILTKAEHIKQKKAHILNRKIGSTIAVFDAGNFTTTFIMYLRESLQEFLNNIGQYILFSACIPFSLVFAVLAWHHAKIKNYKEGTLRNAIIETVSFAAITVAIIGGFVAATAFIIAAPILFTLIPGFKTIYNLVLGFKCCIELFKKDKTEEEKAALKQEIKDYFLAAFLSGITTAAVAAIFLAGKIALAGFGVAVGVGITAYAIHECIKAHKVVHPEEEIEITEKEEEKLVENIESSTAVIQKTIRRKKIRVVKIKKKKIKSPSIEEIEKKHLKQDHSGELGTINHMTMYTSSADPPRKKKSTNNNLTQVGSIPKNSARPPHTPAIIRSFRER